MKHIKLTVKEVSEERRELTEDEYFILNLARGCIHPYAKISGCYEHLKGKGFVSYSLDRKNALFRTETTREATPEEEEAYYNKKLKEIGACHSMRDNYIEQLLAGKEIYPEVDDG